MKIDIEDKREAEDIDSDQLALSKDCAMITYKVDPLRIPRNSATYNGWLENCRELQLLSDRELKESYTIRESLFVSREKTRNLLQSQQEKTEHTIRRRIFETQRQRNELQWQKSKVFITYLVRFFFYSLINFNLFLSHHIKTLEELEKVAREINDLHETLRVKDDALKLAETRLENRSNR